MQKEPVSRAISVIQKWGQHAALEPRDLSGKRNHRMALAIKAACWQLAVWVLSLLFLFLPAGTLAWLRGWIFWATFFSFVLFLSVWLFTSNPSLLAERLVLTRQGQPAWDRVWVLNFYLLSLAWLALMSFDVARLRWSEMPTLFQGSGLLLFLGSLLGIFITLRENHYLSPVVRLQRERGQVVISTGPYASLRHPLYASASLFYIGVPMFLGSWWGVCCAPLFMSLMIYRAVQEERWLCDNLPGYKSYMQKVTWRFLPGVW